MKIFETLRCDVVASRSSPVGWFVNKVGRSAVTGQWNWFSALALAFRKQ